MVRRACSLTVAALMHSPPARSQPSPDRQGGPTSMRQTGYWLTISTVSGAGRTLASSVMVSVPSTATSGA